MTAACKSKNDYYGSYMELSILLPILIILQLGLLAHSIYCHIAMRTLKILFLSLQVLALFWSIGDLFRFVIDPYTHILRHSILCDITSASPKIISLIYYAIFCSLILIRLKVSFKASSFLQVKPRTIYLLSSLIVAPLCLLPISMIFLLSSPCIWSWTPIDIAVDDTFAFCSFSANQTVYVFYIVGILCVTVANVVIGVIFGMKLKKVLNLNHKGGNVGTTNKSKAFQLKSLVIKNSVLTMIAASSTVINYTLWIVFGYFIGIGTILVYLDTLINCLCVALMFSSYDIYYKKLCKTCIVFCLLKMDKGYDPKKVEELKTRERRVATYLGSQERYESGITLDNTNQANVTPMDDNVNEISQ
eukprot:88257_1